MVLNTILGSIQRFVQPSGKEHRDTVYKAKGSSQSLNLLTFSSSTFPVSPITVTKSHLFRFPAASDGFRLQGDREFPEVKASGCRGKQMLSSD